MSKAEFEIETETGPVSGILGRSGTGARAGQPLLIAIHGGTYTSKYFDVPGYSLIDRSRAAGFDIVALDRPGYGKTTALEDGADMLDRNAVRIAAILPELLAKLHVD